MRVPFIAAWAKPNAENEWQKKLPIPQGAIQGQVASVCDLFPTLLKLTGAEAPVEHRVDGKLLQTLLSGEADAKRPEQFLMHYPHGKHRSNYWTSWRDGDWKVIYHALPDIPTTGGLIQFEGGNYQLFNLAEDPYEQRNLADSNPEDLQRMMVGLTSQLQLHEAVYPIDAAGNELKPVVP
jgi:arylsulfatase A-like enzyme